MKFTCEKSVLHNAVKAAGSAVSNVSLPVEQNVKLMLKGEKLNVSGNDSSMTIKTNLVVKGEEDGNICLPAKVLTEALSALAQSSEVGAVTISDQMGDSKETDGDNKNSLLPVSISGGSTHYSILQLPAGDFTSLEMGKDATTSKLKAKDFVNAAKQVIGMVSTNERRVVLTGVLIENEKSKTMRLVASDTFRLGIRDIQGVELPKGAQESVLIPANGLRRLLSLIEDSHDDITLQLEENQISFEFGETILISQLLPGEFPEYRKLIPADYPDQLTLKKAALEEALRNVSVMAKDDPHQLIKANISKTTLELTAQEKSKGSSVESIDVKFTGEDVSIGFNSRYLSDALRSLEDDEIVIALNGAFKPIFIEGKKNTDFRCLLMPVRLSTDEEAS